MPENDFEELISIFRMVSPSDYRYRVKELEPFLSEEAFVQYKSRVEAELGWIQANRGLISRDASVIIRRASLAVTAAETYKDELGTKNKKGTGHDIISLRNKINEGIDDQIEKNKRSKELSDEAKSGVHRPATSFDIVETANAARYRDAFNEIIIPNMVSLAKSWIDTIRYEKDTKQIGRTHLQHAEPMTYGFGLAWYLSRLGGRIQKIKQGVEELRGKFSGSVGAYNASSLFFDDPETFEMEILREMGLEPEEISTQIAQPEHVADLIHYVNAAFGVIANWADDMRRLMMPEIAEVGQPRSLDLVRSSIMPHKRNPAGLENIKSMWKATIPYMFMMYLDQLTEHQRDLTNSASQRYLPQIFNNFDYAVRRAIRVSKSLKSHPENMMKNLMLNADKIISEPLQIILSSYGHPDAHHYVSGLVDQSYESGKPFTELVLNNKELEPYLARFTEKQMAILHDPTKYIGIASKKANKIANRWEKRLNKLGY